MSSLSVLLAQRIATGKSAASKKNCHKIIFPCDQQYSYGEIQKCNSRHYKRCSNQLCHVADTVKAEHYNKTSNLQKKRTEAHRLVLVYSTCNIFGFRKPTYFTISSAESCDFGKTGAGVIVHTIYTTSSI